MLKLHIYLFRHGQSTYNKHQWFTGWIDSKMTAVGYQNARKIARKLKSKRINIAYHSHLSRSRDTLRQVLAFHPECKQIIEDDRIIERKYGILQRHSHQQFMKEMEQKALAALKNKKCSAAEQKKAAELEAQKVYNAYHRSYSIAPAQGESIKDVERRVKPFIADLLKKMKREKINVAISAHGNSMRPFRRYFEHLTIKQMMQLENPSDDYFEYVVKA